MIWTSVSQPAQLGVDEDKNMTEKEAPVMRSLRWAAVLSVLVCGMSAQAGDSSRKCSENTRSSTAGRAVDKTAWVNVTVSNDIEVWWGNRGKAYGNYMRFDKADLTPAVRAAAPEFEPIYFDLDKAALRPEAIPILEKALEYLIEHPKARLRVEGHCCDLHTDEYNMKLGMRRAEAVRTYLEQRGIDPARIETVSYGESRRVTDAPSLRPLNRRAEMKAIPPPKRK